MIPSLRRKLQEALREDIGKSDITSNLLVPKAAKGKAVIVAREKGIFCGGPVAKEIFRIVDRHLKVRFPIPEGKFFSKNQTVVEIQGNIRSILKAERTVLNFLGHLSGIATRTREFVNRANSPHPALSPEARGGMIKENFPTLPRSEETKRFPSPPLGERGRVRGQVFIFDTRKTTPGLRLLEKYAVKIGGGENHRAGLYGEIFVKENHRPYGRLNILKKFPRKFVIEVRNRRELHQALKLRPRLILFDNFRPDDLRKAVQVARKADPKVILEASGGVTLENVSKFAACGVDQISVGSLTHSVKAVDFTLLVK